MNAESQVGHEKTKTVKNVNEPSNISDEELGIKTFASNPTTPTTVKRYLQRSQSDTTEYSEEKRVRVEHANYSYSNLPSPVPCFRSSPPLNLSQICINYPHVSIELNDAPPYLLSDEEFKPNPDLFEALINIGISEVAATKGLFWTGNSCSTKACNWVLERFEQTLNTPLEDEIQMLREDLEVKEREARARILSTDSGLGLSFDEGLEGGDYGETSSYRSKFGNYKMVLIVNVSLHLSPEQLMRVIGVATGRMITRVSLNEFGDNQLELWDADGGPVHVLEGLDSVHLTDIKLTSICFNLELFELGRLWDCRNQRFRDLLVLALWGKDHVLHQVVGRLTELK